MSQVPALIRSGYELNIDVLREQDRGKIRTQVETYKEMQDLVLQGDLYRLNNSLEENLFAMEIVSKDKSRAYNPKEIFAQE